MKNILTIIFFLTWGWLAAQNSCFTYLPGPEITAIAEHGDQLWVGTKNAGLLVQNASSLELLATYTASDGILDADFIQSLHFDSGGRLWLSTREALYQWEMGQPALFSDSISGLITDFGEGLVVVGDQTAWFIKEGVVDPIDLNPILDNHCCPQNSAIDVDTAGNLWISHYDFYRYSVARFDGNDWEVFTNLNSVFPNSSFQHNPLFTDDENRVWAYNMDGGFVFEDGVWTQFYSPASNPIVGGQDTLRDVVAAAAQDVHQDHWLGVNPYPTWDEESQAFTFHVGKLVSGRNGVWIFYDLDGLVDSMTSITHIFPSIIKDDQVYIGTTTGVVLLDKSCLINDVDHAEPSLGMDVFPVPVLEGHLLNIRLDIMENAHPVYRLFDATGRLVFRQSTYGNSFQFDTRQLSRGSYTLRATAGKKSWVKKIIIH